jgi:hypothetical protein
MSEPRIRFKDGTKGAAYFADENDRLILVCGAITTEGRFARFDESLCHILDDGEIVRYRQVIGTRDDLEFLDAAAVEAVLRGGK